jgi:hypothetical protein
MNIQNHIRAGANEIFVAPFQRCSPEIFRGEVSLLQHGAHGAVEHQDALRKELAKGFG